jgi:hypothetical protein
MGTPIHIYKCFSLLLTHNFHHKRSKDTARVAPPHAHFTHAHMHTYIHRLQFALDASFTTSVVNIPLASSLLTHTRTSLTKGGYYFIRIYATNSLGDSVPSSVLTEHALAVPTSPRSLTATVSQTTERTLSLTWVIPSDTGLGASSCQQLCSTGNAAVRAVTQFRMQRVGTTSPANTVVASSPQSVPAGSVDFTGATEFVFTADQYTYVDAGLVKVCMRLLVACMCVCDCVCM